MPIFDLTFRGPLHLGVFRGVFREEVLEWIPSDSLYAALINAWSLLGNPIEEQLQGSNLQITSLFPRANDVRFYPAPPYMPEFVYLGHHSPKKVKQIRWLSQGVFDQLCRGEAPKYSPECMLHGGSIWAAPDEMVKLKKCIQGERLWCTQVVPHVTIDRMSQTPNLHYTGRLVFAPNCGLWFGARGDMQGVHDALTYMMDAGLGGLRSIGHGAFTYNEQNFELPAPESGWGICLSRYAPASKDELERALQSTNSAYRLTTVGGWCQDGNSRAWRRRSVRLVEEGSILPHNVRGKLVDVKPLDLEGWIGDLHPVYRSGLAFLVPAGAFVEVK